MDGLAAQSSLKEEAHNEFEANTQYNQGMMASCNIFSLPAPSHLTPSDLNLTYYTANPGACHTQQGHSSFLTASSSASCSTNTNTPPRFAGGMLVGGLHAPRGGGSNSTASSISHYTPLSSFGAPNTQAPPQHAMFADMNVAYKSPFAFQFHNPDISQQNQHQELAEAANGSAKLEPLNLHYEFQDEKGGNPFPPPPPPTVQYHRQHTPAALSLFLPPPQQLLSHHRPMQPQQPTATSRLFAPIASNAQPANMYSDAMTYQTHLPHHYNPHYQAQTNNIASLHTPATIDSNNPFHMNGVQSDLSAYPHARRLLQEYAWKLEQSKYVSFPSGDFSNDKYIGLKRIGAGTFADIWEVYDQSDPDRKHWAIKVLKKSKCMRKRAKDNTRSPTVDFDKYAKYSNAMIAEGNRIMRLNKMDHHGTANLIRCREILKCLTPHGEQRIHQHGYDNNVGPCIVLELMGVSLLQFTQTYQKDRRCVSLMTVRCIAVQLCNALSYLHGLGGYIHADLKPENVLLTLQHSINGNLLANAYPEVKIVDLGNALSYNRTINTFEVQSLYYRAPEVLFGNEMTSKIDMWSIGCILFELVAINEFNRERYFKAVGADRKEVGEDKDERKKKKKRREHHALFACCNRAQLANKIHEVLCCYPNFVYNKFSSLYFGELCGERDLTDANDSYADRKKSRKMRLLTRLVTSAPRQDTDEDSDTAGSDDCKSGGEQSVSVVDFDGDQHEEYVQFVDLISALLDPNPATRYTSEDVVQHAFCIDRKFVAHDRNMLDVLSTKFHSVYPKVSLCNDLDRQHRLEQQVDCYELLVAMEKKNAANVSKPNKVAVTRKVNEYTSKCCTSSSVRQPHSRVVCLLKGCCQQSSNRLMKGARKSASSTSVLYTRSHIPPLKKMRFNRF